MAVTKYEKFIRKNVERKLRAARRWNEFYSEYLEKYRSEEWERRISCRQHRRWKIWREMLNSGKWPEAEFENLKKIWKSRRQNLKKGTKKKKKLAISRRLPKTRLEQIKVIATERAKLNKEMRKINRRLESERRKRKMDEERVAKVMKKRALKQIEIEEARVKRKIRAMERQEAQEAKDREEKEKKARKVERDVKKALSASSKVKPNNDDGKVDIVRDIKWVYQNLNDLIEENPHSKVKQLNRKVLARAPSNGAIAVAHYALTDTKAFFEKYVVKILPKDTAEKDDGIGKEEKAEKELDPDFSELHKYLEVENSSSGE